MKQLEEYEGLLAGCLGRSPAPEYPKKKSYFNRKLKGVVNGDCFDWIYFLSIVLRGYARQHLQEAKRGEQACKTLHLKSELCVL